MPSGPIQIQKDDLDKPDAIDPGPAFPGYRQRRDEPARVRTPWQVQLTFAGGALLCVAFLLFLLYRFLARWAETHPDLIDLLGSLLWASAMLIVGAAAVGGVAYGRAKLASVQAHAKRAHIIRDRADNPVNIDVLMDRAVALAIWQAQFQAAQQAEVLMAPSRSNIFVKTLTGGHTENAAPVTVYGAGDEQTPALPPPNVPILDHLRSQGHIWRSGNSIMVGYDEQATPHYIDIANAPVIGVAGASQYGKSSFVRFALAQLAAQPGPEPCAIVMCDPHGAISEKSLAVSCRALAPSYLLPVATEPDAILASVRQTAALADARLKGHDTSRYHIVLVIDEFTALMNRGGAYATEMVKLLRAFGNEYGKVSVTTFLIGQSWNSDLAGGTALRNAIQAMVVYGCKRQQAAFLLGTEEGKLAETLGKGTGEALFKPHWASDLVTVRVPWVGAGDLEGLNVRQAPSVRLESPQAPQNGQNGRTDGGRTYTQDKIKLYLLELAKRGRSREWARQWAENHGLRFENKLWTDALEEARKIETL